MCLTRSHNSSLEETEFIKYVSYLYLYLYLYLYNPRDNYYNIDSIVSYFHMCLTRSHNSSLEETEFIKYVSYLCLYLYLYIINIILEIIIIILIVLCPIFICKDYNQNYLSP